MVTVPTTPRRVLIVEADESDGCRLARELAEEAFCVTIASSDEAAERLVESGHFDAALIEVENPRGRGVGLMRLLRRKHPDTKVIMMTTCGDEDLWAFVLEEGASDLVPMPARRTDLACWLA